MGLDRLLMVLAGKDSLRDVTAFPKAQSGADPMTGAPASADPTALKELGIEVTVEPEEQGEGER
jgi:aspartyl-tRNA synthetase